MNDTVTVSSSDAQTGAAFAALLAEGDLDGALALHNDPITLAATMILGQHVEAYLYEISDHTLAVQWPVIAEQLRTLIGEISTRRSELDDEAGAFLDAESTSGPVGEASLSPELTNEEEE